jgi:hypothetical protein
MKLRRTVTDSTGTVAEDGTAVAFLAADLAVDLSDVMFVKGSSATAVVSRLRSLVESGVQCLEQQSVVLNKALEEKNRADADEAASATAELQTSSLSKAAAVLANHSNDEDDEDALDSVNTLVSACLSKTLRVRAAAYFKAPVDDVEYRDYRAFVRTPIDLSVMEGKADSNSYVSLDDYRSDVKLLVSNCKAYCSGRFEALCAMADRLGADADRILKEEAAKAARGGGGGSTSNISSKKKPKKKPKVGSDVPAHIVLDLFNQVVSVRDSDKKGFFFFVMDYQDEVQLCTLVQLEVRGTFPSLKPDVDMVAPASGQTGSASVTASCAGGKRWVTIPEERGCDVQVSALDCVVVEGFQAVKNCPDADDEEWHIPMSNTMSLQ